VSLPRLEQSFVCGSLQAAIGVLPKISSTLSRADRWGAVKVRWGVARMDYRLDPGLYALGDPDDKSPVVVTANYKLSFDRLREVLPGRNIWILVLETNGINVWCAAGKGTFGTQELINRIRSSGLTQAVSHRILILPQLGAVGVSAHRVKMLSGFKAIYGPIRSEDLPEFLDSGLEATPQMRRKTFNLAERSVLIPIELISALKLAAILIPVLLLVSGLGGPQEYWSNVWTSGGFAAAALLGAIFAGTVLTPVLLPWLPGRAFALKGLSSGLVAALVLVLFRGFSLALGSGRLELFGWILMVPAASSYLAMNFTGASTYTSLSGVKKEMRWALPLQIGAAFIGLLLWLMSRFME
jgi:hypothetical protein